MKEISQWGKDGGRKWGRKRGSKESGNEEKWKGIWKRKGCKLKAKRSEKIQKKNGINEYKHLTESIYKSFDQ